MLKFIQKIFGTKSEKDIKAIMPIIAEINRLSDEYDSLSDDEIKAKTIEFKQIIKDRNAEINTEIEQLRSKLVNEALDNIETAKVNDRLNQLTKLEFEVIEDTLDEILPQAFACVKQACKRLKESGFHYEY